MQLANTTTITFRGSEFISFVDLQDQNSRKTKHGEVLFFRQKELPDVKQFISKRSFLKKDFDNETRHLIDLQKVTSSSFSFPFLLNLSVEDQTFFQPYLGIPYSSFIKSYHSLLDVDDFRSILIQTYLGLLTACDIGRVLDSDKHCDNILIETLPRGFVASHTYRLQFTKDEYIEISFKSKYWVWLIDWGSARTSNEVNGSSSSRSRSGGHSLHIQPSRCSPGTVLRIMHRLALSLLPTDNPNRATLKGLLKSCPGIGLAELFTPNNPLLEGSINLVNKLICGEECRMCCDGHERSLASRVVYDGDAITTIRYIRHKQQIIPESSEYTPSHAIMDEPVCDVKPRKWSNDSARVGAYKKMRCKHLKPGRPPKNQLKTSDEISKITLKRKASEELSKTGDMIGRSKKATRAENPFTDIFTSANPDLFNFVYDTMYIYVEMTMYGAGLGVFAKTYIPKGTNITEYCGVKDNHTNISLIDDVFKTHIKATKLHFEAICGLYRPIPMVGVASLINSSTEPNVNLEIEHETQSVWAVSITDIGIGTELLADYRI